MAERRVVHQFECSAADYWQRLFLAEDFNRALFLERLGFSHWELVRQVQAGRRILRELEAEPPLGKVPGPLKRVVASGAGYREQGTLDLEESRYTFEATTRSLPDRLRISGTIDVTDVDGGCERICVFSANAKLFGVGGLLEDAVADSMSESYTKSAAFTREWLARNSS